MRALLGREHLPLGKDMFQEVAFTFYLKQSYMFINWLM